MNQTNDDVIDDKYNSLQTNDMKDDKEDKRTTETIKREDFLSIVKGSGDDQGAEDPNDPNIERDGVQFKKDGFTEGFKLNTTKQPDNKPLIMEIGTGPNE